ncbi:MAG: C13 family peptidase [Promethearchaeota archaeon]
MQQKTKSKIILLILLFSFPQLFFTPISNLRNNLIPPSLAEEDCIDAWIIVCGDRSDHHLSSQIWLTSQWVYHQVQACGIDETDIYYIVADYDKDYTAFEDNITSDASLEYAFQTWAPSKVGENGLLGVYMVSHGGSNSMAITPHGSYTAAELDDDLDAFEAASGCDRMLVIYEACSAGTFLDEPSDDNRIIITSTAPDLSSSLSPTPPNRAMFADNFFPSLVAGNSVGQAFVDANNAIIALGYGDGQKPHVEDNHDAVGHPVNPWGFLPHNGDGIDANNLYICGPCQEIYILPPFYFKIPIKKWIPWDQVVVTVPVNVQIENTTVIDSAHVRVVPSNWEPPIPIDPEAMGGWDQAEDTYRFPLTLDPTGSGNWTGMIELFSPERGDYHMTFIVEDVDGYRGPVVPTQLGINDDGEPPQDTVDPTVTITTPYTGEIITEPTTIIAIGADDNSGLEDIQLLINGDLVKTSVMPDYLPYPELTYTLDPSAYGNGVLNITAIATDKEGNTASVSTMVTVEGNPRIPGYSMWVLVSTISLGLIAIYILVKRKLK